PSGRGGGPRGSGLLRRPRRHHRRHPRCGHPGPGWGELRGAAGMTLPAAAARDFREVVARKRDGFELEAGPLRDFVLAFGRGDVPDYLAAAFLMAAFINGLSTAETFELTRAMVDSGVTLPLTGVSRPKVDKHSTGGVSDG